MPAVARRHPRVPTGIALCLVILIGLLAGRAAGQTGRSAEGPFPGVLLPEQTALIKSMHDDRIAEVKVRFGTRVKEGDLLVRLVDDQERVELGRARALLEQRRVRLERIHKLHAERSVSDEILDSAETDFQIAKADAELARIRLDEMSIRAPFDGLVAERFVDPGASVEIGDPLVRVTALSPLRVEVLLPEGMLPRLTVPAEIEVMLSSPERTLRIHYEPGAIVVDPGSGTVLLQLEVENADLSLIPGVSCRVGFPAPSATGSP